MRLGEDRRLYGATASLCVAYGAANAWMHRHMVDDAFISLRYARNFVNGQGLVWNPGQEHVEGYTNFLWVLLQSAPLYFGWDPILFCHLVGLACLVSTLYLTLKLSSRVFASRTLSLFVLALAGTNPTLTRFATAGMETPLQALLFTSLLYVTALSFSRNPRWTLPGMLGLSLLAALSLLTRLDSAVLLAVVGPIVCWQIMTYRRSSTVRCALLSAGLIPAGLVIGGWFAWKLAYYGDALPNTFHARVLVVHGGLVYLYGFFHAHFPLPSRARFLLPLVPVCALFARRVFVEIGATVVMAASVVALWCLYVVWAGGDWMGFRMMAPVLPALSLVTTWLVDRTMTTTVVRTGIFVLLLAVPMVNTNPSRWTGNLFDAVDAREASGHGRGVQTGLALYDVFHGDAGVTIAVTAAGVIPYYSGLKTIDILGLNDRWVARHGLLDPEDEPGHRRSAPWSYLVEKRVNLVLCDETEIAITNESSRRKSYQGEVLAKALGKMFTPGREDNLLPAGARMLEIPLDTSRAILAVYLTSNPSVDRAIRARGWRVVPIVTGASPSGG